MTMNRRSVVRFSFWMLACVPALYLTGCGESGPTRYGVSGTVTYKGEPVPYGDIVFEPDSSKGNEGPAARATIEKGAYVIEKEKGAVAGPLRVRIMGYDGNPPPGGGTQPHGKALFPEYIDKVDQPEDVATHDFAIEK